MKKLKFFCLKKKQHENALKFFDRTIQLIANFNSFRKILNKINKINNFFLLNAGNSGFRITN